MDHRPSSFYRVPLLAVIITVFLFAWIPTTYLADAIEFRVLSPTAHVGLESASAIARFFAALVLLLLPKANFGRSIRWIAAGFTVLGLGSILFGSFPYAFDYSFDWYEAVLGWFIVSIVANVFFLIGLVPLRPPRLSWVPVFLAIGFILALKALTFTHVGWFPPLWEPMPPSTLDETILSDVLSGATSWYWMISIPPVLLSIIATAGSIRMNRRGFLSGWLPIAMVFWMGAQIHNVFWPSAFSLVVSTSDFLRFIFAMIVVVAGIFALHRSANEYARLLEMELNLRRQIARQAKVRDDFTRMVAHELGSPLAAIRRYVEIVETDQLSDAQTHSISAIRRETDALRKLVADMQLISTVEDDGFSVDIRPVRVNDLLEEATAYAVTLDHHHPFNVKSSFDGSVLADEVRIGQVLRNLIQNAAQYSPDGAPIELHVLPLSRRVCIRLIDKGYGIREEEVTRIFGKYERGDHSHVATRQRPGTGLGLYLSQQIIEAHGSRIHVESRLNHGSTFEFTLEIMR